MKIVICTSMSFAKDALKIKKRLEKKGHQTTAPNNIKKFASGEKTTDNKWEKVKADAIRAHWKKIKKADAILVINKDKSGVKNYLGPSSLIEMAFAHVLKKKIYLLNPVPTKLNYRDEIEAMKPIILSNDLDKIK